MIPITLEVMVLGVDFGHVFIEDIPAAPNVGENIRISLWQPETIHRDNYRVVGRYWHYLEQPPRDPPVRYICTIEVVKAD